ncbi:putative membrane associated protein [Trypanosoma theileri]|uniref:Putative membrane associated protein n=1 Tax=Trypanosoma theileri TaxID=67003 RepID=A0A1X0P4D8_9TRYP|nr:putative membrane associated protein [Trypanosoma theileri]ORC91523.1 putative membrane associated protein [Trypanosoma theileri]
MTEYKKLTLLVTQLREEITQLIQAFKSDDDKDAVTLHERSASIESLIINGRPRLVKILHKALETDPDRQIYNEKMCEAIKKLFDEFSECVDTLFEASMKDEILSLESKLNFEECPSILWAQEKYDQHMLHMAQTEEWKKRLATNIADLVIFEGQTRAVLSAEEKQVRVGLLEAKKTEKEKILKILKDREEAKWKAELERRTEEHKRLVKAVSVYNDQNIDKILLSVPESLRKLLASHILELLQALRTTPEDTNIRRIRCNNVRVMMDYGHISFCNKCHLCRDFLSCAEILWYMMGYQVEYSSSPAQSILSIIESNPSIQLPCGRNASEHVITEIGFEDYSERFFILHEPNPVENANEWMTWYATLETMTHGFEAYMM